MLFVAINKVDIFDTPKHNYRIKGINLHFLYT